ncbi:hypothetical protein OXX69_005282 [Metschnikowia pulcherrima]
MDIYTRYVSGEHDRQHFTETRQSHGQIKLRPLSGHFDVGTGPTELKPPEFWHSVMPTAAFFAGFDSVLFGHVLTMLYKNVSTNKICAVSVTKFGCNIYENMILDSSSRFWPACQNLTPEHRNSNVRKALAIANLKNFNKLWNNKGPLKFTGSWDETNAGSLASAMALIDKSPSESGEKLLSLDLLQESAVSTLVVDVLYDNCYSDPKATDENNSLVTLLGTQMEQLFDPLLEYSPQAMDYTYVPPTTLSNSHMMETEEIAKVIQELFTVQSNYTHDLVNLLQDFIIPLRVHVLADVSNTTDGAIKVNTVFSPTIDEITRINCILNSTLKVAMNYGYAEVFKVLASLLPFFFKAFARHQASITSFHARFEKFLKHNRAYAFENSDINKSSYTPKRVENAIMGSLFELPKLKLIINRLYDLVASRTTKASNFESLDLHAADNIDDCYRTIIETIDSLGCNEPENVKELRKSRILTPSGKLLTELATGWPEELQYGWMNRKVLAVHELENTMADPESGNEILIIFSDHLLFLDVLQKAGTESSLHLPDVLMNSLVNQKPLPTIANFPKLRVKYWCEVKQLFAKSYASSGGHNLSLTAYGDNCFSSKNSPQGIVSVSYSMRSSVDPLTTCNNIIGQICKAQILNKSSPFHLFKCEDSDLTRFFCAHDLQNYDGEALKSPIAVILNMGEEQAHKMLETHSDIYIAVTLSYLNEHTVQILGYNREKSLDVNDIVSVQDLNITLKDIFATCMDKLLHSSSLTQVMIEANSEKLEFLVKHLLPSKTEDSAVLSEEFIEAETDLEKPVSPGLKTEKPQNVSHETVKKKGHKNKLLSRFLSKLRARQTKTPKSRNTGTSEKSLVEIPQTGIPRGKKPAFQKLYKPEPSLAEASTIASTDPQEISGQKSHNIAIGDSTNAQNSVPIHQPRILSTHTASSSRYSGSVDVVSNFHFPHINELENISEVDDDAHPEKLHLIDRNMGSVRYAPKVPAKLAEESNIEQKNGTPTKVPQAEISVKERIPDQSSMLIGEVKAQSTSVVNDPQATSNVAAGQKDKSLLDTFAYPMLGSREESTLENVPQAISPEPKPIPQKKMLSSIVPEMSKSNSPSEPVWAREVPGSATVTKSSSVKSKDTIFSSRNTANALEYYNSSGLPSRVYSKYKMYEELPLAILNSDDDANWTTLARDSLSNLHAEIQAMKSEFSDRKLSSVRDPSNPSMALKPNAHPFISHDDTFSTIEFVSYVLDQHSQSSVLKAPKSIYDLKQNDSISSSSLVESFGKQLDRNFSLRVAGLTGSVSNLASPNMSEIKAGFEKQADAKVTKDKENVIARDENESCSTLEKSERKMSMENHLTSSDEEYYSSHEFSTAFEFWNKGTELEQDTYLLTSSSSEKTLMNDFTSAPAKKQSDPITAPATKWDADPRILDLVDHYGSIAYLSDILTGEVSI